MVEFISKALFLIAEIGVIVVMVIIILKERQKRQKNQNKIKPHAKKNSVQNQHTVYLD